MAFYLTSLTDGLDGFWCFGAFRLLVVDYGFGRFLHTYLRPWSTVDWRERRPGKERILFIRTIRTPQLPDINPSVRSF